MPPFHTPFTPQTGSTSAGTQGSVSSSANRVAPTFLLNRYAPIQFPQQLNLMPQEYLKILPHFLGEDEETTENHIAVFFNFAENVPSIL